MRSEEGNYELNTKHKNKTPSMMEVTACLIHRMKLLASRLRFFQRRHLSLSTISSIQNVSQRQMCTTSSIPFTWRQKLTVIQKSAVDRDTDIHSTVTVIDTDSNASHDKPLVLGIHGIPGQGEDFEPLITELDKRGIRVVAPTFVGFEGSLLEPWQLNHVDFSTQGRSNFLRILLEQMGIKRVDMLLTHSAGTWLGYKVLADWDHVRSAGLLSPVGARPHKMIRPHFVVQSMAAILRVRALLPVLLPLMSKVYAAIGFTGITAGTHLYASQQLVANQGFHNVPDHAAKIVRKKLPLFVAHSKTDKVVEWEIPREMITKHLTIPPENIVVIDKNKESEIDPLEVFVDDWLARVLLFESGGHVLHKPHSDIILTQILSILEHLDQTS